LWTMRALGEGRLQPTEAVLADLDACLVCRACESACPSSVRYGQVIAAVRAQTRRRGPLRRLLFGLLPRRTLLHTLASTMRLWQRSPLRPLRALFPPRLQRFEASAPEIPSAKEREPLPRFTPARGERLGHVAVLEGCVMSVLFQDVNRDTITLLSAAGFDVHVPAGQTCCGALHEHDGDLAGAHALLARNAAAFGAVADAVFVMNSSGCGTAFRDAERTLGPSGTLISQRSMDVTRFLLEQGKRLRFAPHKGRVTLDAPCHLHHAQGETTAPTALLQRVPQLEIVPMKDAELCCGSAGIYNLDQPEIAAATLAGKLDHLAATGATTLLTGNPGCILQWRAGIRARGLAIEVMHPVTFLARLLQS
jgi:glycolate oxidase iron-sulfur subunit